MTTTTPTRAEVLTEMERLTEQRYIKQLYHIYRKPHLGYNLFFLERERAGLDLGQGKGQKVTFAEKKARWDALPLKSKHRWYQRSIQLAAFLQKMKREGKTTT